MCGIAGLVSSRPAAQQASLVREMCARLVHRGPDAEGYFVGTGAALGQRRLSIVDLSERANQPFYSEDRSIVTTCNGEIYNYPELRDALLARGHRLVSRCDCEILPHLYEDHGRDFVERVAGMFAIALWDERRRRLVLVRDRLGEKPLYYTEFEGGLAFASEIKAFGALPGFRFEPDPEGLRQFFDRRHTIAPRTAFRGVKKLPPGHLLEMSGGEISVRSYWNLLEEVRRPAAPVTPAGFRKLIGRSVRQRLMSDVPLGVYLSGGLDSSSLVATLHELGVPEIQTYSIVFPGARVDESPFSRLVAERFGTRHQELVCEPRGFDVLDRIVHHLDEPIGDPAVIPTFLLSELARQHITVVLTGEGSDDVNAGYYKYLLLARLDLARRLPAPLRGLLPWLRRNPRLRAMAAAGASGPEEQYQQLLDLSFVHRPAFRDLLAADHAPAPPDPETDAGFAYFAESAGLDPMQRFLYLDLKTWLADDLLLKVDKMSMAHGLEARAPFLDHGLVEAAMRVPASRKVDAFRSKRFLRAAMASSLPAPILRRRQHGLVLPLDAWFATSLREYLHDHLHSRQLREAGPFRWSRIEPALARFLTEPGRFAIPLFMLLTFASWLRVFGAQQAPGHDLDRADPALAAVAGGGRAG